MNLPAMPPVNVAAEQSILGTLLIYYTPNIIHVIETAGVRWTDFFYREHRVIYRAALKLHGDGLMVDCLTVTHLLSCHRLADDRMRAMVEACAASAQPASLRDHARIVAEDGRWRRWLSVTLEALEHIYDRDERAFWGALGRVREEVSLGELRVIEGGEAAA
jgi:replicative DNA helicase